MSLITCNSNCAYQKEGYCELNTVSIINSTIKNGCPFFINKKSANPPKQQKPDGYF